MWKIEVTNLSNGSSQEILLLFLDKRYEFAKITEEFYSPTMKKVLTTMNGMY